jgi:hypothetical protein
MFKKELFKSILETLLEGGAYTTLFILPVAVCVFVSLHSACLAI